MLGYLCVVFLSLDQLRLKIHDEFFEANSCSVDRDRLMECPWRLDTVAQKKEFLILSASPKRTCLIDWTCKDCNTLLIHLDKILYIVDTYGLLNVKILLKYVHQSM